MLWLNAFWLISRPSLCTILWPNGTTRQNRNHGLRQLVLHDLIEANDEQSRAYRLGRRGAVLMQTHGIEARYRRKPKPRVEPGLLLASEFAVTLSRPLMDNPHMRGLMWREAPFAGRIARPDASAELLCSMRASTPLGPDLLASQLTRLPAEHECGIRLFVEIDRTTEFGDRIEERVRAWAEALRTPLYANLPDRTFSLHLWVTTGTWARARTIQQHWSYYIGAKAPALFTTVYQLRGEVEDQPLDPLGKTWMDLGGYGIRGQDMLTVALGVNR
jgi:hypothetical protein